ncbi:hypothetical protein LZ198_42650 [Myxococcus sp. K15C18031901]|uniref:hypothetical protein n=1 Tax=Myxococcus dinghuensis TaxID=2906761 RepID=UPI0020A6E3CB|nr:hypothetical protein [Myxococcus dinghuensis]MCP3105566.1 hypothetical protein [Myxococcus dinghuensis]
MPSRTELTISNSWNKVIYEEKDNGKSLPSKSKILKKTNIERLKSEIGGDDRRWLICSGRSAQIAVSKLCSQPQVFNDACRIVTIPHLSNQGLNSKSSGIVLAEADSKLKSHQKKRKRLEIVAAMMLQQMDLANLVPSGLVSSPPDANPGA